MKAYYIGMHGHFDKNKFDRDLKDHFKGIEICNMINEEELDKVLESAKGKDLEIGVHFPMLEAMYPDRDPLVNDLDLAIRERAFEAMVLQLRAMKAFKASYLLVHFPKPMILDQNLSWHMARFPENQVIWSSKLSDETYEDILDTAMARIAGLQKSYGIPIILEIELMDQRLHKKGLLKKLLKKYDLKICLDTARLHVVDQIDPNFDAISFIWDHRDFIANIHLSNLQFDQGIRMGHHPALEELDGVEGWANTKAMLEAMVKDQPQRLLYEHRSDRISDQALDSVYNWVEKTMTS